MRIPWIIGFKMLCLVIIIKTEDIVPRRDETYPPPEFLATFKLTHIKCVDLTGVTEESIKEFSDGKIHEDASLKCYMNCLFQETGVVDKEGELHIEKIKAYVPPSLKDIAHNMFDQCIEAHGDTQCERAWWWHQCWKKVDPKHYFLP